MNFLILTLFTNAFIACGVISSSLMMWWISERNSSTEFLLTRTVFFRCLNLKKVGLSSRNIHSTTIYNFSVLSVLCTGTKGGDRLDYTSGNLVSDCFLNPIIFIQITAIVLTFNYFFGTQYSKNRLIFVRFAECKVLYVTKDHQYSSPIPISNSPLHPIPPSHSLSLPHLLRLT